MTKPPPGFLQDPDAFVPDEVREVLDEHTPHDEHDDHVHDEGCGHEGLEHDDHVDYLHDGHRHAWHDNHWDEH